MNSAQAIAKVVEQGSQERGKISIRTKCVGDWVEISIEDTGHGIPEDIRDSVFDHFFTTKNVGEGTGQGLSIAHAIVTRKHGGEISFESEVGRGTTFTVRLPIAEQSAAAEPAAVG